jgi:hypothetical protein
MAVAPITDGTFRQLPEHALARKVKIMVNGTAVSLTGKQIEALAVAAARNPSRPIGFNHNGERVVLSAAQIESLRAAVESDGADQARAPPKREWFYSLDGTSATQQGPLGTAELHWKYAAGEVPAYAVAWNPRLTQGWVPMAEVAEMAEFREARSGGGGGSRPSSRAAAPPAAEPPAAKPRNTVGRRSGWRGLAPVAPKEVDLRETTEPAPAHVQLSPKSRRRVQSVK